MKTRTFVVWESVFLGLSLLILTPSMNRNSMGSLSSPPPRKAIVESPSAPLRAKPLAVWTCTSSWYGEPFDGQLTADGETYDMYGETAAHPTLPLGSIIRVVNTRNHRSRVVRINDRGPYVEGRELDVSYEVARELGFDQRGTTKVRLELLKVPSRPVSDHGN